MEHVKTPKDYELEAVLSCAADAALAAGKLKSELMYLQCHLEHKLASLNYFAVEAAKLQMHNR